MLFVVMHGLSSMDDTTADGNRLLIVAFFRFLRRSWKYTLDAKEPAIYCSVEHIIKK